MGVVIVTEHGVKMLELSWHHSRERVRRFNDMGLLEWIYYIKPETPHMIKFSRRAQRTPPSIMQEETD